MRPCVGDNHEFTSAALGAATDRPLLRLALPTGVHGGVETGQVRVRQSGGLAAVVDQVASAMEMSAADPQQRDMVAASR
jgi:hypothetical protein